MEYITDVIGEAYKRWCAKKPVIIHAPTGAGKTYFILHTLLPYVAQRGKKMVYLCNRVALKQQVENQLQYDSTLTEDQKEALFVCSYQRFSFLDLRTRDSSSFGLSDDQVKRRTEDYKIINADYYILDEAHYFLADCDFNVNLRECIKRIQALQSQNKDAIWVYVTATLPYLLIYLNDSNFTAGNNVAIPYLGQDGHYDYEKYFNSAKALLKYKEQYNFVCQMFDIYLEWQMDCGVHLFLPSIDEYVTDNNMLQYTQYAKKYYQKSYNQYRAMYKNLAEFDYYHVESQLQRFIPIYYTLREELIAGIKNSAPEEKWLIFVSSKSEGKILKDVLVAAGYSDTVFLDSTIKTKSNKTAEKQVWLQIMEQEKFEPRILIATKVLDNGVNIKDKYLRHIVIQELDQTIFLQMLGRKRFSNDEETVFVYLRNVSEGVLRRNFQLKIQNIILFWYHLKKIQSRQNITRITEAENVEISKFQSRYMDGAHYKKRFRNYLVARDMHTAGAGGVAIKDDRGLLIDVYEPDRYAKAKLTYNYYKMLSMFERAYDERRAKLRQNNYVTEEEYAKDDEFLQQQQFMWLKEQLSWIGISVGGEEWVKNPLNPLRTDHWIGTYFHISEKVKRELIQFLDNHVGYLDKGDADVLKELYRRVLVFSAPYDYAAKGRGSVRKIQEFFVQHQIPYRLSSKKCMHSGIQRNWWMIERLDRFAKESRN